MARTPPSAELLGQFALDAIAAGVGGQTLGEFVRLQCGAQQLGQVAAFGYAVADLAQAGADAAIIGRFAMSHCNAGREPIPVQAEELPPSIREVVRAEVRAELQRGGPKAQPAAREGVVLKITLRGGRITSVSVPKALAADYRAAFGDSGVKALLQEHAAEVPAGTTRSYMVQAAMRSALEERSHAQSSRGPLSLVGR